MRLVGVREDVVEEPGRCSSLVAADLEEMQAGAAHERREILAPRRDVYPKPIAREAVLSRLELRMLAQELFDGSAGRGIDGRDAPHELDDIPPDLDALGLEDRRIQHGEPLQVLSCERDELRQFRVREGRRQL
jgi:hypothetical protein